MSTMISREGPMQGLRALSRILDDAIAVPGTRFRFGLDAVLGLIPGVGDITGAVMTGYTIVAAYRMGVPGSVLLNMVMNLGIDAAVGAVPLLGDVFDFAFKANRRNLDLLERYVRRPDATRKSSRGALVIALGALAVLTIGMVWLAAMIVQTVVNLLN